MTTLHLENVTVILSWLRQQKHKYITSVFSLRSFNSPVVLSAVFRAHSVGCSLSQYVRAQREAVLRVLQVAHLPGEPQSWRGLHKSVHVSLSAGGPHPWLVPQPLTHLRVSQRTWRVVVGAATVSMWSIKLSLSGITRVVWWWRTWRHTIIHVDMWFCGQPVHVGPLLWLHLVRDGRMPGDVTLMLQTRNRNPGLLKSRCSHHRRSCRWPVALPVGAGLAGRVRAQEDRESRDAVDGPL